MGINGLVLMGQWGKSTGCAGIEGGKLTGFNGLDIWFLFLFLIKAN